MIGDRKEYNTLSNFNNLAYYSLENIYKDCLNQSSDVPISVKNTCSVFLSIFPNNLTLAKAKVHLDSSNKVKKSKAKTSIKKEINELLSKIKSSALISITNNANEIISNIQEINNYPRLAEARFALNQGIIPNRVCAGNVNPVYLLYDRHGENGQALGIFKECDDLSASKEVEVAEKLSLFNKINVKQTLKNQLEIENTIKKGIFQKFIQGGLIENKNPTDLEAVDQIQFIGIFDLINLNSDRHYGNLMINKKGKVWAIDHEKVGDGNAYQMLDSEEIASTRPMTSLKAPQLPFSQKVKDHINALDINKHVISLIQDSTSVYRKHVENMIDFLKWAISDNRETPLNLAQIYRILACVPNIPFPSEGKYQEMLNESVKKLLYFSIPMSMCLYGIFPQIEKLYANHLKSNFDVNQVLEKLSRVGSFYKVMSEMYLDLMLENQDSIDYSKVALSRQLKYTSLSDLIEMLARGTKYYDEENGSVTKAIQVFLDHCNFYV